MPEYAQAARRLGLIILFASAGLSGAQEVDPYKVSTGDLLFNQGRLDAHLAARREYLANLETQLALLDDELLESQARLFAARKELEAVEQPSRELSKLLEEIASLQSQADGLADDLFEAQDMLARLEASIEDGNLRQEELEKERLAAKDRVEKLEQQLALVKSSISSTLKLRAAQILDENVAC